MLISSTVPASRQRTFTLRLPGSARGTQNDLMPQTEQNRCFAVWVLKELETIRGDDQVRFCTPRTARDR
jgi:hypothetical protein